MEVTLRKAREAKVSTLNSEKLVLHSDHDSLTAASQKQLEDVLVERSLVASLKEELKAAIPVPETLDDLAKTVEQLVHCTMNKRSHLSTKVKVICESVLSSVFEGKCHAYLTHKASGIVKRVIPYCSAIQIAKVIDLSGSLINLSGYDTEFYTRVHP